MSNVYIVDGLRTPVGKFGGTLSSIRPDDMAAILIKELMKRNAHISPDLIDDVILGCANQAGEDNRDVARMSVLLAGLPASVPGETVNRLCSSGLAAIINGGRAIQTGDAEFIIAGGVESMTRAPFVLAKSDSAWSRSTEIYDTSLGWRFANPKMKSLYGTDSMGETAENVAEKYNISREDQDKFALWSQNKASKAKAAGRFNQEIFPIEIPQKKGDSLIFDFDEFIRDDSTLESLSSLKPVFKQNGTVTAGNASGINDGSAMLLLASDNATKNYGLKPMARIVSSAVVGVEPRIMGIGPVEAAIKALKKANLTFQDLDLIELNEAFAAQALACTRSWGLDDFDERINPNGGAIAIGHPLGMTGARLTLTAAKELKNNNKRFALITMCVGVGQGYAAIIENL